MTKEMIKEIVSSFSSTKKQLEGNLCYMRVEGGIREVSCLATKSIEIAREFVDNMEVVGGVDLESMLTETICEYNRYMEEAYNDEDYVIQFISYKQNWVVSVSRLTLEDEDVQVEPVAKLIKDLNKLTKKLQKEKVRITYFENDKPQVFHTSLAGYVLGRWVNSGAGSEVQRVQRHFEEVADLGVLVFPAIDFPYPTYRHINLLDIVEARVVD